MSEIPIVSVSEITGAIKTLLEGALPDIKVRGEVSNVRRQASGHVYFSLKDSGAQAKAVLFKFAASAEARRLIENGRQIIIRGRLSVYEPQGTYSIVVQSVEEDGVGELQRRFEALKAKLAGEGLFDAERRREIPILPRRIAVVTSESGAAIQDFLGILRRRSWAGEVTIFNARVQGAEAVPEIVTQIQRVDASAAFDLLVVTRGGGSLEDLWAFNEEAVVRAVAACAIPVISAVGHEIDFVLTDFAADWRAETPSGAAERISSAFSECVELISALSVRLEQTAQHRLRLLERGLEISAQRLKAFAPRHRLEKLEMQLDERENRLRDGFSAYLRSAQDRVARLEERRFQASPRRYIERRTDQVAALAERLETCSAHRTLQRGFALVKDRRGRIVTAREEAEKLRRIEVHYHDGALWANPEKDQDQLKLEL